MGMVENSKSVMDRKENKQRNFAESETKHLIRSHNKNAENAIFWTRDESKSILATSTGKSTFSEHILNAEHKMWSIEETMKVLSDVQVWNKDLKIRKNTLNLVEW